MVLWELLNAMAAPEGRRQAVKVYRMAHRDPLLRVVSFEGHIKSQALWLYESRSDKSWSLTDCFSFALMHEQGLTQALTTDHHFEQAGFQALLLASPT